MNDRATTDKNSAMHRNNTQEKWAIWLKEVPEWTNKGRTKQRNLTKKLVSLQRMLVARFVYSTEGSNLASAWETADSICGVGDLEALGTDRAVRWLPHIFVDSTGDNHPIWVLHRHFLGAEGQDWNESSISWFCFFGRERRTTNADNIEIWTVGFGQNCKLIDTKIRGTETDGGVNSPPPTGKGD